MEVWKDIKDFEGYKVSNLGRVKSLNYRNSNNEKLLKNRLNKDGYSVVKLSKQGKGFNKKVHRLVAEAFVPNPENKPQVDHIIPVSLGGTNDALNLRWCTMKENCNNYLTLENYKVAQTGRKHSDESKLKMSLGKKGYRHSESAKTKMSKAKSVPVVQYSMDMEYIMEWPSMRKAEEKLKIAHTNISACCLGKVKSAGGFKWKYKNG